MVAATKHVPWRMQECQQIIGWLFGWLPGNPGKQPACRSVSRLSGGFSDGRPAIGVSSSPKCEPNQDHQMEPLRPASEALKGRQ